VNEVSASHLVLISSYNTGIKLQETVEAACRQWQPVWVIIDGSTDGSDRALVGLAAVYPALRVLRLARNSGKGAAIFHGLQAAAAAGFTHALTMDADGQHSPEVIPDFMAQSLAEPAVMLLGKPVFDASAPLLRVYWRRLSNLLARIETMNAAIGDSLFGFRLYPIADLLAVMVETRWMRRFDFEPEAVIRLAWRGVQPLNWPVPVHYFRPEEGGISHFRYLRDNLLLGWMYLRLFFGFVWRMPRLLKSSRH
jgi:glycosyltransferase involved in cell wall biosynthesis